jgi:hypothetical protein
MHALQFRWDDVQAVEPPIEEEEAVEITQGDGLPVAARLRLPLVPRS